MTTVGPLTHLSDSALRECRLATKRALYGLTEQEEAELRELQVNAAARERALSEAWRDSERFSESRTHNRAPRINPHD